MFHGTTWSKTTLACLLLTVACGDPSDSTGDEGPSECVAGQFCPDGLECISGFCLVPDEQEEETGDGDPTSGDGDGEPTSGDGDGDGDPTGDGDGDGDPTGDGDGDGDPTGDGDGDPTGDGDGDPTGDGDGDPTGDGDGDPQCGNGIIDIGEQCDGNNLGGFTCQDLGYAGGTLMCNPVTCTFSAQNCVGS